MSSELMAILIPVLVNAAVLVVATVLQLLTISGGISAFLLGSIIYYFTGFKGWVLLIFFFVSANIIGKLGRFVRAVDTSKIHKKGSKRDWVQVFANGGIAGVSALLYGLTGDLVALTMFGASLAASTSDTWASEAGILSATPPVSIITFKPVPPGMSGGISWVGSVSAVAGSLLIGSSWYNAYSSGENIKLMMLAAIITVSGVVGSFADSYLGATIQGHYWDPENNLITERSSQDGIPFELCRGIRWIDNDMVNLISNVIAVLFATTIAFIIL
ncbi:MAG: DUF92 domain-containing protein [Spirochaetia bacterium]|nr:DUF92 domain-containing protein [Spirochaetia bacterium]